ncbi:MAG: WG repeat-containing protein, partial [Bacteroidales bacterium]|nr:WG repeat-containing protein [Bacteroidales bacterium]
SKADFDICKEAKLDPNEQDAKKITEALQKLLAKLQYQKNNRKITQQEYEHKYPIVNTVLSAIKPTQNVSKPVIPAPQQPAVTNNDNYLSLYPMKDYSTGKWGFADKTGKVIIPFVYDVVHDFKGGVAIVKQEGKYGIIDKTGKLVLPLEYRDIQRCHENFIVQKKNKSYGIIDKTGKTFSEWKNILFHDDFSEPYAAQGKNGKWGYIDRAGKTVIPFQWDKAQPFFEGEEKTFVKKEGLIIKTKYLIDKQGNIYGTV